MNICRTCLITPASKDISELEQGVNEENKTCLDIMVFCLDIEVNPDSEITTNLCNDCYTNIISFYKFKVLSLKNDAYLKYQEPKLSVYVDENGIKYENPLETDEYGPSLVEESSLDIKVKEDDKDEEMLLEVPVDVKHESTQKFKDINTEYDNTPVNILPSIDDEFSANGFEIKSDNESLQEDREVLDAEYDNTPYNVWDEISASGPKIKIENENSQEKGEVDAEYDNIFDEISASSLDLENNENVRDKKAKAPIPKKRGRPKKIKLLNGKPEKPVCEECGVSVSVRNFKEHLLSHRCKDERPQLQCKDCPKLFSTQSGRRRHYRITHLGVTFKCEICKKEVYNLVAHNSRVHDKDSFRFGCALCDRRFPYQYRLDFHLKTHTKHRPYECDECHKTFYSKGFISRHIQAVHAKQRMFHCQFCSKDFFSKGNLQRHIRVHTKERPFACSDCGKAFGDKSSLRDHRLIHTGTKSQQCPHCDMSFVSNNCLRKHLVKHTKEKRYPCQFCDKAFGRSDHRNRHELTAHKTRAAD